MSTQNPRAIGGAARGRFDASFAVDHESSIINNCGRGEGQCHCNPNYWMELVLAELRSAL